MVFWFGNGSGGHESSFRGRRPGPPTPWLIPAVVIALALAAAIYLLITRAAGGRAAPGQSSAGEPVLVVSIIETGNRLLDQAFIPDYGREPLIGFATAERRLVLADRVRRPRTRRGAIVQRLIQDLDVTLVEEVVEARRLPWVVDLERPVRVDSGTLTAAAAGAVGAARLTRGSLRLVRRSDDGHLTLEHLGQVVDLAPDERYACLWVAEPDGVRFFGPGPAWDTAVDMALTAGKPMTSLIVINRGLWREGE